MLRSGTFDFLIDDDTIFSGVGYVPKSAAAADPK